MRFAVHMFIGIALSLVLYFMHVHGLASLSSAEIGFSEVISRGLSSPGIVLSLPIGLVIALITCSVDALIRKIIKSLSKQ